MTDVEIRLYLERLDQQGLSVFVKALDQGYLAINQSGAKTFQKTPQEIIGHSDPEYFDSSSAQLMIERDQNIVKSSRTAVYDSVAQIKGEWKRFKSAKFPVTLDDKTVVILGISFDFDKKADDQKLALLNEATLKMEENPQGFVKQLLSMSPTHLPR